MRILHLTLTKKWFDMILSGDKKEEYREDKPYWHQRLCNIFDHGIMGQSATFRQYDLIRFTNGYGKDKPTMDVEFKGIRYDSDGNSAWGHTHGDCFIIPLGGIINKRNIN